jgi:hypothetical protein
LLQYPVRQLVQAYCEGKEEWVSRHLWQDPALLASIRVVTGFGGGVVEVVVMAVVGVAVVVEAMMVVME